MSLFNVSNTYDYMNNFFGTSSNNNSSSLGMGNLLGDYYAVQNGSYLKLAKQFYAKGANNESTNVDNKKTEFVKAGAEEAIKSLNKLMDDSLFKKVETKDEDGNTTYDYDKDAILKNLKSFAEDYNAMIKDAGEMDGENALRSTIKLIDQMEVYESALARIGISIKSDNTLAIDEDAFKAADMTDAKALFTGSVSMAKNIQTKLLQVYTSAGNDLNQVNGLYSSTATTYTSLGSMFDSIS